MIFRWISKTFRPPIRKWKWLCFTCLIFCLILGGTITFNAAYTRYQFREIAPALIEADYAIDEVEKVFNNVTTLWPLLVKGTFEEIGVYGQPRTVIVSKIHRKSLRSKKRKRILLWTPFFNETFSRDYYFFQDSKVFERFRCDIHQCDVTANKNLLEVADAILFNGVDVIPKNFPKTRDGQIKIVYALEAPLYFQPSWLRNKGYFNWTMTYRSDSDVPVKYGQVYEHVNGTDKPLFEKSEFERKADRAIWMVSNCPTLSGRDLYVQELQKYYPVDIYGRCGSFYCAPAQSHKCYEEVLPKYKFYISFENSICNDYVTEKFFNVINYDIVPVVFGGARYDELAPPKSYIDALSFPSPKVLASYLKAVGNNFEFYRSFLRWKRRYSVHLYPWMCDLCHKLHKPNVRRKNYDDLWSWWVDESNCRKWTENEEFVDMLSTAFK